MAIRTISDQAVVRKRRIHKKSRNGCKNCKLRSVKCDEKKPSCERCESYGVLCAYGYASPELQVFAEGGYQSTFSPGLGYWQCRSDELLEKFQVRTALTVSFGDRLQVYQKDIASLATWNSHLFHGVMTLALAHDRHLSADPNPKMSESEAYHWYRATSAFSQALTRPPRGDEQTALLTTAALLGCLSMSNVQASTPEESWPYAPDQPSDLTWLTMSEGKKEVFKLTQRTKAKPTPLFKKLSTFYTNGLVPGSTMTRPGNLAAKIPRELLPLYDLDKLYSQEDDIDDPLQWAAGRLAMMLASDQTTPTLTLGFILLISTMRWDFKNLLKKKDPRALVLLAWWFAKVGQLDLWWLSRRSMLEGQSICMYIEREWPHDTDLQKLLEYPRSVFSARSRTQDKT